MKTSTFKILFRQVIGKRKNDQAPIYARITVNGERTEFSLNRLYPIKDWDGKMSRARGRTAQARTLNDELDNTYADITASYKELCKEGKLITAQVVKARYLGTDNNQETLLGLVEYHKNKMNGCFNQRHFKKLQNHDKVFKRLFNNQIKNQRRLSGANEL